MNGDSSRENPLALYQEALATFDGLLDAARASGDSEPTAMTLATADGAGRISARVVLLKGVGVDGFRFYTNYESLKGTQLAAHPRAALCFHWKLLGEQVQVRIEGDVSKTSDDDSDAYFATRARGSQIGAWASLQSQTMDDPADLDRRVADVEARFAGGPVPRPPHWSGFRIVPERIEFWKGMPSRLHVRNVYTRQDGAWTTQRLYP